MLIILKPLLFFLCVLLSCKSMISTINCLLSTHKSISPVKTCAPRSRLNYESAVHNFCHASLTYTEGFRSRQTPINLPFSATPSTEGGPTTHAVMGVILNPAQYLAQNGCSVNVATQKCACNSWEVGGTLLRSCIVYTEIMRWVSAQKLSHTWKRLGHIKGTKQQGMLLCNSVKFVGLGE